MREKDNSSLWNHLEHKYFGIKRKKSANSYILSFLCTRKNSKQSFVAKISKILLEGKQIEVFFSHFPNTAAEWRWAKIQKFLFFNPQTCGSNSIFIVT